MALSLTANQGQLDAAQKRIETAERKITELQSEAEARDKELSDAIQKVEMVEADKVRCYKLWSTLGWHCIATILQMDVMAHLKVFCSYSKKNMGNARLGGHRVTLYSNCLY